MTIYTIGHSTRTLEAFTAMLAAAQIDCIADVRRFPRSRRHPQFNAEHLAPALAAEGILYRPFAGLGGRREARRDGVSPHLLWREAAFRNYADYAEGVEFRTAFADLLQLAAVRRVAIMCAEAVWWRCHRRIIADYALAAGAAVEHILDLRKIEPALLTPGATIRPDGSLLYGASTESGAGHQLMLDMS
ncbi:MAG TPA: DUF488 domain-containing protein [Stellaceae bacterium]|nr:DUF488 domain-containing protein [Stellaceae bacterium]